MRISIASQSVCCQMLNQSLCKTPLLSGSWVVLQGSSVRASHRIASCSICCARLTRAEPGENNSPKDPPQYCPPLVDCQVARLAGTTCYPPQGKFEPVMCKGGYYCPLGGAEQIQCPAGHYCTLGSYKPTACSPGASCPPGTNRNMSFLPPGLILAIDTLLLLLLLGWGLFFRFRGTKGARSRNNRSSSFYLKKATSFVDKTQKGTQYQSLDDDDFSLEARITNVRRMDTGFGGAFDAASYVGERAAANEPPKSDLDLFIQSMSKSMDTSRFGLSFEFTDLTFKPKKAAKPVLSDVTGQINRGSLWGVMGASGAGKCTYLARCANWSCSC